MTDRRIAALVASEGGAAAAARRRCTGEGGRLTALSRVSTVDNLMEHLHGFKSGLATLVVHGGRSLATKSGKKPSPFCTIYVEDPTTSPEKKKKNKAAKTRVALQEASPTWDEEFELEIPTTVTGIRVVVSSYNKLINNEKLGEIFLPAATFSSFKTGLLPLLPTEQSAYAVGSLSVSFNFMNAVARNCFYKVARSNFNALLTLIVSPDLHLAIGICDALSADDTTAVALVRLFNKQGQAPTFVSELLDRNVCSHVDKKPCVLFRGDSIATKVANQYFRLICYQYLQQTLRPHVEELLANVSGYEIDPERAPPTDDLKTNGEHLVEFVRALLKSIFEAVDSMPYNVRLVLSDLHSRLEKYGHPELCTTAVAAIFFLRFVCPAICFPEQYYLTSAGQVVEPEQRRILTLAVKIIQSLANAKTEESYREAIMAPLFPLIEPLQQPMEDFLHEITNLPGGGQPDTVHTNLTDEDYVKLMSVLVRNMADKLTSIEKSIGEHLVPLPQAEGTKVAEVFQQLQVILRKNLLL
eukprot:TRINITY_DN3514_c0_g1_i3.p1 TRINITY_DN3514_c0_g1~~TRINITY_DN3514_c0_g1_i3.p1  ORF type:complete len:526 (+),score=133.77 TRINITY_DN3514_c0_g1_i3:172-1749(+)